MNVRYEYCRSERLGRVEGEAWVIINSVSAELKVRQGSALIASRLSPKCVMNIVVQSVLAGFKVWCGSALIVSWPS